MTEDAQLKIRLPRDLKERIEAAAVAANRSWNGEIVSRLEKSFLSPPDKTLEERLISLEEEFADFKLMVEATYRRM
ncbi:Arc family DNA-binding protein [Blastochloris viridis]|uniref:Arc-like DNA binding domain protein n=1 Tax=Blastochloris viridis TaxID=1079 RepID=A0A0P0J8T1_BLAVI|nr:Arc family DNA-binding protein [Blastochloris viridis]ALK10323.1 Arc-like DNA binding domain protein [Blastochloris viridis]CUU42985.1 Arc-like DNA binding domain protein [Blastochloris viridis]